MFLQQFTAAAAANFSEVQCCWMIPSSLSFQVKGFSRNWLGQKKKIRNTWVLNFIHVQNPYVLETSKLYGVRTNNRNMHSCISDLIVRGIESPSQSHFSWPSTQLFAHGSQVKLANYNKNKKGKRMLEKFVKWNEIAVNGTGANTILLTIPIFHFQDQEFSFNPLNPVMEFIYFILQHLIKAANKCFSSLVIISFSSFPIVYLFCHSPSWSICHRCAMQCFGVVFADVCFIIPQAREWGYDDGYYI